MRHCIFVIGTRAQLVKVAPVIGCVKELGLTHSIWLSGQHTETIDDLIADFRISSPVVRMRKQAEQATVAGLLFWLPRALIECRRYVSSVARNGSGCPLVVVHGDTLSTLVSAISGRLAGGYVVHLESGLTSGRLFDPFPEEIVRRLTFRMTRYAVCPNVAATLRMRRYRCEEIVNTGENTLLDCVRYALTKIESSKAGERGKYFVVSIHRVQNLYRKSRLASIVDDVISISALGKVHFILHPATRKRLVKAGLWETLSQASTLSLEPRMPYTRFLSLIANARGVFSDGGSNQEELSYLGVPTVLFRERSERPDGLGRNVVLRHSIGNLADFIRSGQLDRLRMPHRLHQEVRPSRTAAGALIRWSTQG